jgi:hypothetical protein
MQFGLEVGEGVFAGNNKVPVLLCENNRLPFK